MNEEIIKLLTEAKQQYEERTELSEQCLCDFLYNLTNRPAPAILRNYIRTFTEELYGYYKKIKPICGYNPTQEVIEEHYAARLELINLCINHFNSLQ